MLKLARATEIKCVWPKLEISGNLVQSCLPYLRFSPPTVLPWAMQRWANYDIRLFAKEALVHTYANKEHALCVLNHHGDLDWMIGWCLIERIGMLGVSGA